MMSRSTAEQYSKPNRKTPVITKVTYAEIDVENRIWWTTDGNVHTSKPWNSEWTKSSPWIAERWRKSFTNATGRARATANATYTYCYNWLVLLECSYRLMDMHHKLTLPCSLFRTSIGGGISGKQPVTSTDISTTNFCRWPSPFLFLDVHTSTTANACKPSERRLYSTRVGGKWPTAAALTISLRIHPLLADISALKVIYRCLERMQNSCSQCCQKLKLQHCIRSLTLL